MNKLLRLSFRYHVKKPITVSPQLQSLRQYRKALRDSRRELHIEAYEYQNQIEDQYLQEHMKYMKKKHYDNECQFRKTIFIESFILYENMEKWKKEDQLYVEKMNQHLHKEDIRRINRQRILKILDHQSNNFWFNNNNVDKRLTTEVIFPQYIASTEYYYKLQAQALAYDNFDLDLLDRISSNEEAMIEKNKFLIPKFKQLRQRISVFKKKQFATQKRNQQNEDESVIQERVKKVLKQKLKDLFEIFRTWKQYTDILGLTSVQVLKTVVAREKEGQVKQAEKIILKSLKAKTQSLFVGSVQEDTEDDNLSFNQYLQKIDQKKNSMKIDDDNQQTIELDSLMQSIGSEETVEGGIDLDLSPEEKGINIGAFLNINTQEEGEKNEEMSSEKTQQSDINPEILNKGETNVSVQILKECFADDPQLMKLLNLIGQIELAYPKLLEKIWGTVNL